MEEDKKVPGLVMIDETYGFKVTELCYTFGKVNDKGEVIQPLYPTTMESLINIYAKQRLADLTVNQKLSLREFKGVVDELKNEIKRLASELTVKC